MKEDKIKILIADDEKWCSDEIKLNLSKIRDIEILGVASTDEDEINMIEELKPEIVITDLMRDNGKNWGGLDIIKKYIDKESPSFIIISFCGESSVFTKLNNVEGFINKYPNINYDKLVRELRRIKKF